METAERQGEMGAKQDAMQEGRAPARTFRDLIVWQKAHQFVLVVYRLSDHFPKYELFGLTSQLRRAAVSIPANIAEGFRKRTEADKGRFLNIAQGSAEECSYYLILCNDLQCADARPLEARLGEVSRLLARYMAAVARPKL